MNLKIRKAEKSDFNRINELFIEMLQTIYNTDDVNGYEEGCLDRFFDGGEEWISLAVDENEIVAFLSIEVHHEDREYIYLDDFSVTKTYRNKGIGTMLINNAEEFAKKININSICLHVEKSNDAAFRFYERLGYRIFDDQGERYLMVKDL